MTRAISWDAVHDGRAAFRVCMDAMCAPGRAVELGVRAGLDPDPARDRAAAVLLALLDVGVSVAVCGDAAARTLVGAVISRSGAAPAPVCDADFVLVTDDGPGGAAGDARRGTPLAPHDGATIIYAGTWKPVMLDLAGPGVQTPFSTAVPLPAGELTALQAAAAAPPTGVDAFVVSEQAVIAIPRSVLRPRNEET